MPSVLIVGAGPTGLTAAVELARRGLQPTLIERRAAASNLSRAVGISAASLDILEPSGVAQAIRHEAVMFDQMTVHNGKRPIARLPLNFDDRSRIYGLAQDRTEALLDKTYSRLGGALRYRTEFQRLAQDADGVTVTLNGLEERYDYVLGADGVHSSVRKAIGVNYSGYELPDLWSIADVSARNWPRPGAFKAYLFPVGRMAVVVPIETDRFRIVSNVPDALKAFPAEMDVTKVHCEASFRIHVRQADDYAVGRVFLAGDAAHSHSPVGGRGMNLGIADAADFAARLAEGRLAGYHAARHPEGARVIAFSERARRMVDGAGAVRRSAVAAALMTIAALPPLARFAMRRFVGGAPNSQTAPSRSSRAARSRAKSSPA